VSIEDNTPLTLTPGDKVSPTWLKLVRDMERQLKNLRGKNDDAKLNEIQTAIIRGQIQTLKVLIALGEHTASLPD
jgi:hypothetical protein